MERIKSITRDGKEFFSSYKTQMTTIYYRRGNILIKILCNKPTTSYFLLQLVDGFCGFDIEDKDKLDHILQKKVRNPKQIDRDFQKQIQV